MGKQGLLTACMSAPAIKTIPAIPINGFLPALSLHAPDARPPSSAPNVVADVMTSCLDQSRKSIEGRVKRHTFSTSESECPRSSPMTTSVPEITPVS